MLEICQKKRYAACFAKRQRSKCANGGKTVNKTEKVVHEFGPFYDENSRVLILGSIPSPKSREQGFYYGHPRNRFWPVLAGLFDEPVPETVEERKAFLTKHNIALWDVLASCDIRGADDGSIKNPEANNMELILNSADIRAVFTTGGKATKLYERLCLPVCGVASVGLPSTSPANCGCSMERLMEEYGRILKFL